MIAITFWTLFFMVFLGILVFLALVYSILDGIRYSNEQKQAYFDYMTGEEPDWMKDERDD